MELVVLPEFTKQNIVEWGGFTRRDKEGLYGLDVETTAIDEEAGAFGADTRIRTIQFGSLDEAWVFDVENPSPWANYIQRFLQDKGIRFVHHTAYDPHWVLRHWGIDLCAEDRAIDLIVMANLLWPGPHNAHDLKSLAERLAPEGRLMRLAEQELIAHFRELAPKGFRVGKKMKGWGFTNIDLEDPVFGRYAGLDAIMARRLLPILAERLTTRRQGRISRAEQKVARVMAGVTARGHLVDQDRALPIFHETFDAYKAHEKFLTEAWGFSPRSPKRGPWLEAHGVRFTERTPTGAPKLDKFTVPVLAKKYAHDEELGPIFDNMVKMASLQNLLVNLNIIVNRTDENGRVHPKINTQQAVTGRMSITKPAMQTFKKTDKRLRNCFMAAPGNVLIGADYDGQETCLAAAFSRDPLLLKIVRQGLKQHVLTATEMFGKDYTPDQYHNAKTLDFAQQYGAGPKKLAATLGVSLDEARKMWLSWRRAYSKLVAWTDMMGTYAEVENPFGRIIPADPMRRYKNGNLKIQSTGRDVLGQAIVNLDKMGLAKYIWLPIHDELILEVPEDLAESAMSSLGEAMTMVVRDITLKASPELIGTHWGGGEE